jgi:pSer/pThr/pTyr-binding forkhead associated (FHA) protein
VNNQQQDRHVLIVNDGKGRHAIALEAAAYSIGRDETNAIVLDFETVSRQHAILLRVPIPGTNSYKYRLVDGNSEGQPSTNGIFVNGQRCTTHELKNGDMLGFGRKIKASYMSVAMADNEFVNYLESIDFQSIKFKQVDPKATLVGGDVNTGDLLSLRETAVKAKELAAVGTRTDVPAELDYRSTLDGESSDQEPTPPSSFLEPAAKELKDKDLKDTVHESVNAAPGQSHLIRIVGIGTVIVALAGMIFCWSISNKPQPPAPAPQQTAP